jgi:polygalacturonase
VGVALAGSGMGAKIIRRGAKSQRDLSHRRTIFKSRIARRCRHFYNPAMKFFRIVAAVAVSGWLPLSLAAKDFNVLDYGAKGDGQTPDTAAIQRAIDAAAQTNGRVVIPHWRKFLTGALQLKSGVDFHLSGELVVSTNPADYSGDAVITATDATDLRITGGGKISGRSLEFMTGYDAADELWVFKDWRPAMLKLTGCKSLVVRDITIDDAPSSGLQLLDCEHVLVDDLTVKNRLDAPDNDGIIADHCSDMLIQNCTLTCGDDAIVVKSSRQTNDLRACADIRVRDCKILTQSAGLKIGTETAGSIHDISFERCKIVSSGRGLCIQLRDEGDISDVTFRDITLVSRYYADWWWGRGEAISFTAYPRTAGTKTGKLHDVLVQNVSGRAENSIRINGGTDSRIRNVRLDNVTMDFGRWTKYPGAVYDNRPTRALAPFESHVTDGFNIRFADNVTLSHCAANWLTNSPDYFQNSVGTENSSAVKISRFRGESDAHPINLK